MKSPLKKYNIFQVYGQSMFPALKHKDKILATRVAVSKVKIRDIIVYKSYYCNIVHRVIKIVNTPDGLIFYTRGDFDRTVKKIMDHKVLGRVTGRYRKGKLKFLSFECSFIYCLIMNILSLCKELLKRIIEKIYSYASFRKIIKLLISLKIDCLFVENTGENENFKSFYNFYPFAPDKYFSYYGFLAQYKNISIGKLWLLDDKKGNYFLYGPYVKVLYRARNTGSILIKKAINYLQNEKKYNCIYALILNNNEPLIECFKKFGFRAVKTANKKLLLLKKSL